MTHPGVIFGKVRLCWFVLVNMVKQLISLHLSTHHVHPVCTGCYSRVMWSLVDWNWQIIRSRLLQTPVIGRGQIYWYPAWKLECVNLNHVQTLQLHSLWIFATPTYLLLLVFLYKLKSGICWTTEYGNLQACFIIRFCTT